MKNNQSKSFPRSVQNVTVEIDRDGGYLCRTYELFSPATLLECKVIFDDLEERFQNGERSINKRIIGGLLIMDEDTIVRYMDEYAKYKTNDLPGIYERTCVNFWEAGEDERLDHLHRVEAIKRLLNN